MSYIAQQAKAQNINAASKFSADFSGLLNLLGKVQFEPMAPGSAVTIYKSAGTLEDGSVEEGEQIPASKIKMEPVKVVALEYLKYRKLTPLEQVGKMGYDIAVLGTNEAMLKDVRDKVIQTIYDGLEMGTTETSGVSLQSALANAWGLAKSKYEDNGAGFVFFANVSDVADYLGTTPISIQQEFGMNYVRDFLGLGDIIISTHVPAGTVYATAKENMGVYAGDMRLIDGFEFYTDPSGIIGVHNEPAPANGAYQTTMFAALAVFPIFVDRVIKAKIGA